MFERQNARFPALPVIFGVALTAGLASSQLAATAADLPKATEAILQQLKVSADLLKGLDGELAVPAAWIDGARKANVLKITGSDEPPMQAALMKPFAERYPFIKVEYSRGAANERVVRPLMAYSQGRFLTDVAQSVNGSIAEFTKMNAAENLSNLPVFKSAVAGAHDPSGLAVSFRSRPYCMSYNTNLLKKEQLPKTWKEFPDTAILANGRIGAVMLPHLWLMPLWHTYGEQWALKYIDDFFVKMKPQIRPEGLNAAMALVGAGENYVSVPAYPERVKELQDKGTPIGWHCPDMVPLEMSKLSVFRGSPGIDAARLYVNWLLSSEGQLSQVAVFGTMPVHKDLQRKEFFTLPEEMEGKPFASYDDQETIDRFLVIWNKYAASARK